MNAALRDLLALLAEFVIDELVAEQATSALSPELCSNEGDMPENEQA